jgi:DNA-binding HxlR family transcriptional regulator
MENRENWSTANCSIARTLEVVGTRAAVLILREAFFGTRRFDDFARLVGISEPVAAARLKELTADGVLERVPYQEPGQRTRFEYRLTAKGRALQPMITAMRQWGDEWATDPAGPPVRAVHRDCGAPVSVRLSCEAGHDVPAGHIDYEAGSGLILAS